MTDKTYVPDLGAIAPAEYVRRDDATEKRNEVPGRQLLPQPESLVEIRSAVHSNYAGMVAMIGADNLVYLGRQENYRNNYEQPSFYDNSDGSLCFITDNKDMYYFLYGEGWSHPQAEMLERGLTAEQYREFARLRDGVLRQFEAHREILFAGQPFHIPENYLKNVEQAAEANYNMVDGQINNAPPERADLTDGQTHAEIAELAPETLPESRPSVLEKLKAELPERDARTVRIPEPERGL